MGDLLALVTVTGKILHATPNHPILTDAGWKSAGFLNLGDNVVEISEQVIKTSKKNA